MSVTYWCCRCLVKTTRTLPSSSTTWRCSVRTRASMTRLVLFRQMFYMGPLLIYTYTLCEVLGLPSVFEQRNLYSEKGPQRSGIDSAAMNVLVLMCVNLITCQNVYMPMICLLLLTADKYFIQSKVIHLFWWYWRQRADERLGDPPQGGSRSF